MAGGADDQSVATPAKAAVKPANSAIPVGLNEAALDSPTFRAAATHLSEQIEAVERWLNGYVTSTSRLIHDLTALEDTINTYLSRTIPSAADGVIDNDYTFLALKRVGDGSREYWMQMLSSMKRTDNVVVEPIRQFLVGDMRNFKEIRKVLETAQRTFDTTLARYVSQSKTKEPSALREDAFAVFETRKAYLQASMDFCQLAPQLRFTMDKLLVKVCSEIWKEMKRSRDAATNATRWVHEMDRVRGWAKEMEQTEGVFRRELQIARRDLGDSALANCRPSRELEDYSTSTVAFLGSRGPVNMQPQDLAAVVSEKQGWLFLRTVSGKPVRHNWVRRWYYCRNGVFGWLVPTAQGVLQGDEIGVLLCNARPAPGEERRFCFEIKTKSQNLLLQAETQGELTEWLEVFEVTKKKAFEESMNGGSNAVHQGGADPAFSISPPSIPEFSAVAHDAQLGVDETNQGVERMATLPVPGGDNALANRASFDVNGSLSRRSITALGRDLAREEGESGREHAARIIQKFDLHRKSNLGTVTEASGVGGNQAAGGIASLISASHNLLPVNAGSMLVSNNSSKQSQNLVPSFETDPGALAPSTLAKPPAITNMSRTAMISAGERGMVRDPKKLPASIVANYWGSNVWGVINVPDRTPELPRPDDDDPVGVVVSGDARTPLGDASENRATAESLPTNYPAELRAQHAQFRLLFPNVPSWEQLVLVFRAAWSSSGEAGAQGQPLIGEGRIYVTPDNMYFYGQQMGLVTAYSLSLDIISEVTATAGKDCDFIFLKLGQAINETGYTAVTIKVFLEDLQLLQARLNLLIDDLQAEEPMETEALVSALIHVERDDYEKPSPSAGSWEEIPGNTPVDDGTPSGRPVHREVSGFSPQIRPARSRQGLPPQVHLPTHAVDYAPEDMKELATERHFEISAKSCFHVLFGDKSFIFPKLYFERRAQQIAQGPWTLVDQAKMHRDFQFHVDYTDLFGRAKTASVHDQQTIEVFQDHVTYVVSHIKTAWHLPYSRAFRTVTKIVITHQAKSKCKLAIYTRVDWIKAPALVHSLVERQALRDAESDAEELAELTTDQVRKLGHRSRTNRSIQVYGNVGHQTQVVVFSPGATDSKKKQSVKRRTLTDMVLETLRSWGESVVSSLIMWAFAGLRSLFSIVTANWLILILLGLSIVTNLVLTASETSSWWKEQRTASFMQRIGVAPNMMMSKAVYIADLADAAGAGGQTLSFPDNSTCFTTFQGLLDATDMDAPWEDAGAALTSGYSRGVARKLKQTRQRLGTYRHDLLVAMRVVNSIEREMVQSEWENWLMNEKMLCDDLDTMLQEDEAASKKRGGSGGGSEETQKTLRGMPSKGRKALEEWRGTHCGSCRRDHDEMMRERRESTRI
ncbi:BAR domain of APPL family protein [Sarocladium implicatum]|nr:BAR domain of APPL family protein [Sarocladium implicatum]